MTDINQAAFTGKAESFFKANYFFPRDKDTIEARYRKLYREFLLYFGAGPLRAARAPGRVNLLGEHTDYNNAPVLPMAIDRDIAALYRPRRDNRIVIRNADKDYGERSFNAGSDIPPYPTGDWGNYPKAAVSGLAETFPRNTFTGFDMVMHGTLPAAGGLSSSSALVVLSGLIFNSINGINVSKLELADLMAAAERYVGTQGGGMDQAASLLGETGAGLKIDFNPLKTRTVPLPPGYSIIIAHSTVSAPKTESVMDSYNSRAASCRMAAHIIRHRLKELGKETGTIQLIGDLKKDNTGMSDEEILEMSIDVLGGKNWTVDQTAGYLGISPSEAQKRYLKRRDGSFMNEPASGFPLADRFLHVFGEWKRVEQAAAVLDAGDGPEFGRLMNQSHASCRDLFEISCPELDALTAIAVDSGAAGSRLSGAGFGGCTVSLVESARVAEFVASLEKKYYREYLGFRDDLSGYLFPVKAAGGAETASIYKNE
ncbi:MAG: galactokinase [Spirochaetia bacterium]